MGLASYSLPGAYGTRGNAVGVGGFQRWEYDARRHFTCARGRTGQDWYETARKTHLSLHYGGRKVDLWLPHHDEG